MPELPKNKPFHVRLVGVPATDESPDRGFVEGCDTEDAANTRAAAANDAAVKLGIKGRYEVVAK